MAKSNNQTIQREQQLCNDFNQFWNAALNSQQQNYYGNLTPLQIVELKKVLSGVNNIITMKTTLAFAKILLKKKIISNSQYNDIQNQIMSTNPNSPGFDINYSYQKTNIVAEVKCNIPANGNKFGQAQVKGVDTDINNLLHGKGKMKGNTSNCYKFFVLLDDGLNVQHAMNHLINSRKWNNQIKDINQFTRNDKQSIYLIYVPIHSI